MTHIAHRSPTHHRELARALEPIWLRKWCKQRRPAPENDNFEPLRIA